jgi:prepilin-type N-terminal cleavage/methylation domain-containing protein
VCQVSRSGSADMSAMRLRDHQHRRQQRQHHRRRGFTLIELLVVIGIIALLVGIILPSLGSSRAAGRRVKCLANLKGIGVGVSLYMDTESKGVLLPRVRPLNSGSNTNDPSLLDIMAKYVDAPMPFEQTEGTWVVSDPWRCPSDKGGADEATGFKPMWESTGTSYEYWAGLMMLAAETLTVKNVQFGVSKAYETSPRALVLVDADDWHNPRFNVNKRTDIAQDVRWDRNGLMFGDWRAEDTSVPTTEEAEAMMAKIVQYGGGLGG